MNERFNVAIAIVVFNRLDCAIKLMDVIKEIQPTKLYIISDGPRNAEEKKKVPAGILPGLSLDYLFYFLLLLIQRQTLESRHRSPLSLQVLTYGDLLIHCKLLCKQG